MTDKNLSLKVADISKKSKDYLGLDEEAVSNLKEVYSILKDSFPEIINAVLSVLTKNEDALKVISETGLEAEKAVKLLDKWLNLAFSSKYEEDMSEEVFKIGYAHVRAGVPQYLMPLTMGAFLVETLKKLFEKIDDKEKLLKAVLAVSKAYFWNITIMLESYKEERINSFLEVTGMSRELFERMSRMRARKK